MDNAEKKRLANEKRLKAIQQWQKNRNPNVIKVSKESQGNQALIPKNKIKIFNDDDDDLQSAKNNQLKLFDSDDGDEDFDDCFKIRPQFEGKNGLRMLEMSSELSDRFKLDERFKDEEEPINEEEDSEKNKNIRILESILGHEVGKKHPVDVSLKRKREIERFDPEAESGTSCMKNVEDVKKKPRKKIRKIEPSTTNEEIPHSSERYIEVSSNLKDIISSASTFSFTEKFNLNNDIKDGEKDKDSSHTDSTFEKSRNKESKPFYTTEKIAQNDLTPAINFRDPFFISDTDERLKEGVEFFMRPKSLDEIREEWNVKRIAVLDIFKNRRKAAMRSTTKKPNKSQTQRRQFPHRNFSQRNNISEGNSAHKNNTSHGKFSQRK